MTYLIFKSISIFINKLNLSTIFEMSICIGFTNEYFQLLQNLMGNFCEQYGLPPIAHSRQIGKKHDKSHKKYKYKNNFVKPNDFYAKKKNV